MNQEKYLKFLKNNRTINKGKTITKNMLNINCIKNNQKNNPKKIINTPLDKFVSIKYNDVKKKTEKNSKEKKEKYKDNKSSNKNFIQKKRNYSYIHNLNANNCTINNNINYSNNNNINFNMINNNININNNKFLTKQSSKCDNNNKNKIRKKMILSEINTNCYNTNITSLNNEISKIVGENNITSYFDINNKNIINDSKHYKNNSNKNIIKCTTEKYLSNNNSYHYDHSKKSDENKNKTKIIFINYQNFRRNNTRLKNNSRTQINNGLNGRGKPLHQLPKRKFNNSQTNIIMNNMKKSFYTTYLYTGLSNSKNDPQKTLKYNSNNTTINKNSQNKKYFNLSKDNSILNLTGSFNSQKHIFTDGINLFFENNENDTNLKKIIKKNKSSILDNTRKNTGEHLSSIKDLLSNKFIRDLNNIYNNLEKNLNQNMHNNSKIKKFKIIKNSFENFLKLLNQNLLKNAYNVLVNFLKRIYSGYNELITSISTENQKLKKINTNLTEKKEKIEKKYLDLEKMIEEKQEKLKILEQKFISLINYVNTNTNLKDYSISNDKDFTLKAKSMEEGEIISTVEEIEQDVKNGKIFKMNKNNLDDLDALYFFDKIKMAPQRSYSEIEMPSLNLFKKLKNANRKEGEAMAKNKLGIINISDIKFTSNYFNKFKQAFENVE
jgi:hypothetical protein